MSGEEEEKKEREAEERTAPAGAVVYRAIQLEGEEELKRDSRALGWSGLAAGLSMGFSLVCEALLRAHLPARPWEPAVSKLGYSIGFLIVILGRQQLFTKNTLTVILPLLREWKAGVLVKVIRLWIVVLLANLAGAFAFAWLLGGTEVFDAGMRRVFAEVGREAIAPGFGTMLLRAILAGWLIALMVWLLPFAESARLWVIVILGYFVGLGGLAHVIAGSVETFYLVVTGEISFLHFLGGFLLPALIGNVIGGVSLVAALAHVQFMVHDPDENISI